MMRLFQGCFLITRLAFSLKFGWIIRWQHWFGWIFPCTWIILVIQQFLRQVVWGRWGWGIRKKINIILCHTETFLFSHCIIITQRVLQFFLRLINHEHHIISLWIIIFFMVKSKSQFTHPLLKTHSNQEHDNENLHPTNPEIIGELFHSIPVWRLSYWECVLHVYLFLVESLKKNMNLHPLLLFVW